MSRGYELNGIEFKGPGSRTNKPFFAKVARAVLGMANRRDGGLVIIGVDDETQEAIGLDGGDLATWLNFDDVSVDANRYADPSIRFDIRCPFVYKNKNLVILAVHEFDEIPVLCRKDYGEGKTQTLRQGACYVRTRKKPETAQVPSQEEMRELLDLAIDKGVRRFVTRAQRAGLFSLMAPVLPLSPSAEELFRKQIEDMG